MARLANGGDPLTQDFPTGPGVGEPVPDFELPDQHGRPVQLSERGARRALILFYRSASW